VPDYFESASRATDLARGAAGRVTPRIAGRGFEVGKGERRGALEMDVAARHDGS